MRIRAPWEDPDQLHRGLATGTGRLTALHPVTTLQFGLPRVAPGLSRDSRGRGAWLRGKRAICRGPGLVARSIRAEVPSPSAKYNRGPRLASGEGNLNSQARADFPPRAACQASSPWLRVSAAEVARQRVLRSESPRRAACEAAGAKDKHAPSVNPRGLPGSAQTQATFELCSCTRSLLRDYRARNSKVNSPKKGRVVRDCTLSS
jgi:hypothetical protein